MSGAAPSPPSAPASLNEAVVGAILDGLRSFRHAVWAPALLGVIMLFDSWDSIAIAYAMPTLSAEWRLNPLTMGFAISAGYGGQFLGALSLGAIAERLGRLPVVIVAAALMSVLAVASAAAQDYTTLLLLRLVQGVMIGGAMPVAITYVNELAPTKTRGRYFGIFQTLAISGFAVASLSSQWIVPHLGWRWMLGLGAIPIVLLPLVWITLPESPRWLARTGRLDKANQALVKLGAARAEFPAETSPNGAQIAAKKEPQPSFLTLISPAFRARTLVVTSLWFLTMFVSFGLTTWVPSIYVKSFHFPVERALHYSAITSTAIWVALVVAGFLIDRFGRRPFALGGLLLAAAPLLLMSFTHPTGQQAIWSHFITTQIAIFFPAFILWPYTAEIYPTNLRALALGYASSIGRAASMLTPIFVGFVLNQGFPIWIVIASFGAFALTAFVVWATQTRETRGTRLETI